MNSVEQPKRQPEIQKRDLAYQVLGKYFWAKSDDEALKIWKKTQKENPDRLAEMAWVSTYNGSIDNGKQNIIIANRLRKNDVVPFYDYQKNATKIDNFNEVQKMYQSKNLSDLATLQYYITNLDDSQIAILNALSVEQRALFIVEQCQNVDRTQWSIQSKMISKENIENKNLAAMKELMDMQEKLEKFIQKYGDTNTQLARFAREKWTVGNREWFVDQNTEKEFQKFFDEQKNTKEYAKLVAEYNEDIVKEQYRQLFIVKNIDMNSLSEEAKREFMNIVVDIYDQAKKFGIDMVKMWFDMIYNKVIEMYRSPKMYVQLSQRVMADEDFNAHFDKPENKVEQLVPDNKKDLAYYKNLIKLYPETDIDIGDGTKLSDNLQYLNEDMSVVDSAPNNFKNSFSQNKNLLLDNAEKYEKKLLDRTNAIIQQSAIEQCLLALQKTMNIEIDQGENLLEQIKLDENLDAVIAQDGQLLLNIKGNLNGKQIALTYDLVSGKVYYQKYMQKTGFTDIDPITIGATTLQTKNTVPFLTLPTLGNIIQKGKVMSTDWGYRELMENAEDVKAYEKWLQDVLQGAFEISETIDHEVGKEMIKKNILEDMIVQKVMKIGDRSIPTWDITSTQYPIIYDFYSYIHRSFSYYDLKPIVQLENRNTLMDDMLRAKKESITTSSDVLLSQEKWNKNQERFVLHGLVNQKVMGLDNTETRNQNAESHLLSFFQCFEKDMGGMKIVDVEMMSDFFRTTTRNSEQEKLGKWEKTEKFNGLYRDFHSKMWEELATKNLDEQLDYV